MHIPSISSERRDGEVPYALSVVSLNPRSFIPREAREGLRERRGREGVAEAYRGGMSLHAHICLQDGIHNTRLSKSLESGRSRRVADLMTQRRTRERKREREGKKREEDKERSQENLQRKMNERRENGSVMRYGMPFLVPRHSLCTHMARSLVK